MNTEFNRLKRFNSADIEAVLARVEKSFDIKFDHDDLGNINSYRMLADVIASKINLEHADTCTTQQAFYKLRNAIAVVTGTDKCSITPRSRLANLLPRENRLETIAHIERELGFNIDLLRSKQWVVTSFILMLLASFIACFYNWEIALAGCSASILGLKLAGKFGKEIHLKTVGDLANRISRESYVKARRDNTVNRNEVERKVRELFLNETKLDPVFLYRNWFIDPHTTRSPQT